MKIFLDLDGVFADFDKFITETCGEELVKTRSNEIWPILAKEWRPFYRLDLITDALKIITMLQHHDLEFLTALPEHRPYQGHGLASVAQDKTDWVYENISRKIPVNTVVGGKNKYLWLEKHPGAVLIDDYDRNINQWNEAGGIGILHTDTESTIIKLDNLNLL